MKQLILSCIFLVSPILASPFSEPLQSAEMWWCESCGLAYPSSQKWCLNKDCPLFRKRR